MFLDKAKDKNIDLKGEKSVGQRLQGGSPVAFLKKYFGWEGMR